MGQFLQLDMIRYPEVDNEIHIPPDRRLLLIDCLVKQLDMETSCYVAGIPFKHIKWVSKQAAKHPEGPAEQLMMDVIRAKASGKFSLVADLFESDNPRWKAWLLEKMYPEQYGKKVEVNVATREQTLAEVQRRIQLAEPEALMQAALEEASQTASMELGTG